MSWVGVGMERKWEINLEVIALRDRDRSRERSYQGRISKVWHSLDAGLREQEPEMPWRFPTCANREVMEPFPESDLCGEVGTWYWINSDCSLVRARAGADLIVLCFTECLEALFCLFYIFSHLSRCLTLGFLAGLAQWFIPNLSN